ncbi:hydrogenase formation protein HypD [Oscillospiraceae bacterium LTW-04]|nr:hydrogenase formation protein HypD [Oscillospiraceae bacterium MB24-C1]
MTEVEKKLIKKVILQIKDSVTSDIRIMEICGTHTHQIARFGIRKLLTSKIHFVSGPGCPVCVTERGYIDALITLLEQNNVTVATFGDLLRVQGTCGSLEEQKSLGKKVLTVYSPEDVLSLAQDYNDKSIVFAAVGFETTAPLYAALIKTASMLKIKNLFFLTSLKRMEPAIRFVLGNAKANIDGILCPGHVAAITGIKPFLPITTEYHIPAVICGFDEMDLVTSINVLCKQIAGETPVQLINTYKRCVSDTGNEAALSLMNEVFKISEVSWRGIGKIKDSAMILNGNYEAFDACKKFGIEVKSNPHPFPHECECGKVMIGEKTPDMCKNFGCQCTPEHPLGPCMTSSEGACSAYYKYGGSEFGSKNYASTR